MLTGWDKFPSESLYEVSINNVFYHNNIFLFFPIMLLVKYFVSAARMMKQTRKCEVAFAYSPLNDDELELVVGETVEILREVKCCLYHHCYFRVVNGCLKTTGTVVY